MNVQHSLQSIMATAHRHWGETFAERGDYLAAIKACTRALRLNAKDVEAYEQRGIVYMQLKDPVRALRDFDNALALIPRGKRAAEIHTWKGLAFYNNADYSEAMPEFNLAIFMDARHSMAYVYRGLSEVAVGNPVAAITDFTQAIYLDPENFIAYRHRGDAHLREGHLRQALSDYLRYVDLGLSHHACQVEEVQAQIATLQRELHFA